MLFKIIFLAVFIMASLSWGAVDKSLEAARWYNWSNYYYNLGKYDKAAEYAEKALSIDPYQEGAYVVLQKIKLKKKNFSTKWDKMHLPNLVTNNKKARSWYFNGLNRYLAGDFVRAYYCFKESFSIVKDDPAIKAMFYRSRFRISMKSISESEKRDLVAVWKNVIKEGKKDPESSYYWFLMGRYYYEQKNEKIKGLDCFKIALAFDDKNKELVEYLKNIEKERNKEKERKALLEQQKLKKMEANRKERDTSKEVMIQLNTTETKITSAKEIKAKAEKIKKKKDFEEFKKTLGIERMSEKVPPKTKPAEDTQKTNKLDSKKYGLQNIKDILGKAQKKLDKGEENKAIADLKKALLELLKEYPEDLAVNYYLTLIYQRENNSIKATEHAVKCMYIIENYAYEDKKLEYTARVTMDCYLRAAMIQASLQAYNNREKKQLKAYNFSMLELIKKGYFINKDRKLILELKLPDTEKKIKFEWHLKKWDYLKWKDDYFIDSNGLIECREHGLSPFLIENTRIEEY